jgi:hypothetical protein
MKKLFIILLITLLFGCNVDLSKNYKVSDNYYVGIIDIPEDRSLYYDLGDGSGVGRVNGGVTAVGWDNYHIIIEQHKDNKILFYILEINKDNKCADPSESVSGPFNETEFNETRIKLNVDPKLGFSKRFSS